MTTPSVSYAFADLWESVCAEVGDRTAIVCGKRRASFAEVDDRASRLAGWLAERGVGPGSYIGVQMRNQAEYVESMLAGYKLRAIPVNINYRLVRSELSYLYNDCALVGVIHDEDLAADVEEAARDTPSLCWALATGEEYARAVEASTPPTLLPQRSSNDVYALYTGGTTGQPKAIEWRMEDAFFACVGGGDPTGEHGPITAPTELAGRILDGHTFLPAAPLVHAAGMWTTLRWLFAGCPVVLLPKFSPREIWEQIARARVTVMNIVGDAMAIPLLDALPPPGVLDLSCLQTIATGGAPLSPMTRERLLTALPQLTVRDSYGSSETGVHGWATHTASGHASGFSTTDTVVLDPDTCEVLSAGSARRGVVARTGHVPLRYHGDDAKTATTFLTVGGKRYALTGDIGWIEADGTLRLLGRNSQCINSGGEKIYPEEVEQVIREHPGVEDVVVVGVPDERWGQMVVALVAAHADQAPTQVELQDHCRSRLAGFKMPKRVLFVSGVARTVSGKQDYRWAVDTAVGMLARDTMKAGPS